MSLKEQEDVEDLSQKHATIPVADKETDTEHMSRRVSSHAEESGVDVHTDGEAAAGLEVADPGADREGDVEKEAQPGSEAPPKSAPVKSEPGSKAQRLKAWLLKWHLPLLLIFAVIIGALVPGPGEKANETDLGGVCFGNGVCVWSSIGNLLVTGIFLLSGLKLKTDAIKNAISAWQAALFGVIMILFVTPCISFALIKGDYNGLKEFGVGLAIFFAMPTTLSSGPIIVGQAKGNVALALLLTVVTNVLGVFTAPLFVSAFLKGESSGEDIELDLDPVPVILQLLFTILVPLIVGKMLRRFEWVQAKVKEYSLKMKLLSSGLLAVIPWMKVSSSADSLANVNATSFVIMLCAGIAVHLVFLVLNYTATTRIFRFALPEEIAVVIVASQKTLPVAITILDLLPGQLIGSAGLVAIPMIVSHLAQILIDSFVAAKYAAKSN